MPVNGGAKPDPLRELDLAHPEVFAAALAEKVAGTGALDDQQLGDAAVAVLNRIGGSAFRTHASHHQKRQLGVLLRENRYTLEGWVLFALWVVRVGPQKAFAWDTKSDRGVATKGFVAVRFLLGKSIAGTGAYEGQPLLTAMGDSDAYWARAKEEARVAAARAEQEKARVHRARERTPGVQKAFAETFGEDRFPLLQASLRAGQSGSG